MRIAGHKSPGSSPGISVVRSIAEENIPPETNPCARQDPADEAKVAAAASEPDVSGEMPGTWEAYPITLETQIL